MIQIYDLNALAAKFYIRELYSKNGQEARKYIEKRQLSIQAVHMAGIGYAPKSYTALYDYLKEQGVTDQEAVSAGLCIRNHRGIHDRFWNRLMFPVIDMEKRVCGFGGRVLGDSEPKYLNSPETEVFVKHDLLYGMNICQNSNKDYIVLCEGYMDVIALQEAGFINAVASLGTAFTENHAKLIKKYTNHVFISYDSDGPGQNAIFRALPVMKKVGLSCRIINMSPAKDPDEFIRRFGKEAYFNRIANAMDDFSFRVEALTSSDDMDCNEIIRIIRDEKISMNRVKGFFSA